MVDASAIYRIQARDETAAAFAGVRRSVEQARRDFAGFGNVLAGLAGAGGLALVVRNSINAGDRMRDLANMAGLSTEQFSRLDFAARQSGASTDDLSLTLKTLQKNLSAAANGSNEQGAAFRRLGLDAQALLSLGADEQMMALADALNGVRDPAERVELAMAAMGRNGAVMLQTLEEGSAGLRAFAAESDATGHTLSQSVADEFDRANDAITRMDISLQSLVRTLAVTLGPTLAQAADGLSSFVRDARDLFSRLHGDGGGGHQGLDFVGQIQGWHDERQSILNKLGAGGLTPDEEQALRSRDATLKHWIATQQQLWDRYYGGPGLSLTAAERRETQGLPVPRVVSQLIGPSDIKKTPAARAGGKSEAEKRAEELQRLIERIDPLAGKTRQYTRDLKALDDAWLAGNLSAEEHERLVLLLATGTETLSQATHQYGDALRATEGPFAAYARNAQDAQRQVEEAFINGFASMEDALVQFLRTGKLDFKSFVDGVLDDLARIYVRQNITAPLAQGLSGGGFLDGLGGLLGGSSAAAAAESAVGFVDSFAFESVGGGLLDGLTSFFGFHDGGVVGRHAPSFTRRLSAAALAGVPRYHGGGIAGLAPDEVPAILQTGERVLSRDETAAYDGGGMSINIHAPIDARGADAGVLPRINEALVQLEARIYRNIPGIHRQQMIRARHTPY